MAITISIHWQITVIYPINMKLSSCSLDKIWTLDFSLLKKYLIWQLDIIHLWKEKPCFFSLMEHVVVSKNLVEYNIYVHIRKPTLGEGPIPPLYILFENNTVIFTCADDFCIKVYQIRLIHANFCMIQFYLTLIIMGWTIPGKNWWVSNKWS